MNNTPVKVGIIGCGNMGGAFAKALAQLPHVHLFIYDRNMHKMRAAAKGKEKFVLVNSPAEVAAAADLVMLCVKPQGLLEVVQSIAHQLTFQKVLLSIAVGINTASIRAAAGSICPVVRIMPNTPLLVGEGVFALALDDQSLAAEQKEIIASLLERMGKVYVMPEEKIDAFSSIVGSGPGFFYIFLQAMEEAAVAVGFSRKDAKEMVLATAKGSATLAESTGNTFQELYEMVASPAGTTIAGALHLERTGVRGHIADAVLAAYNRARELGNANK